MMAYLGYSFDFKNDRAKRHPQKFNFQYRLVRVGLQFKNIGHQTVTIAIAVSNNLVSYFATV